MPDFLLAAAFVLMIIAPCVIAIRSERRKTRETGAPTKTSSPEIQANASSTRSDPAPSRHKQNCPTRLTQVQPLAYEQTPRWQGLTTPPAPDPNLATGYELLIAQALATKAQAAALAAAAQAAAAKAEAASLLARHTARAAAQAQQAAHAERHQQARTTQQEQARRASGENILPATHPSLDFPRSSRPNRA